MRINLGFNANTCAPERDIVPRRLPRQKRIVLKQDADLRTRQAGLDGA